MSLTKQQQESHQQLQPHQQQQNARMPLSAHQQQLALFEAFLVDNHHEPNVLESVEAQAPALTKESIDEFLDSLVRRFPGVDFTPTSLKNRMHRIARIPLQIKRSTKEIRKWELQLEATMKLQKIDSVIVDMGIERAGAIKDENAGVRAKTGKRKAAAAEDQEDRDERERFKSKRDKMSD
jgi:hypothetical protein